MTSIGVVVIGRNEAERLPRCLESLGGGYPLAYADSGSEDGSCAVARAKGAQVVELDGSVPHTAARGRNAGLARLLELHPEVEYVQFVDGDCEILDGWLEQAAAALDQRPEVAAVCGILREKFPTRSIFNQLCDLEWQIDAGETRACGGIAMFRVEALRKVGGFDATIAAGEEPELCMRLRKDGWKILRLAVPMGLHDSDMIHFRQWWKRQMRGGHGAMDLVARRGFGADDHYRRMVRSTRTWTVGFSAGLVVLAAAAAATLGIFYGLMTAAAVALLWPLQVVRIAAKKRRRGLDWRIALAFGFFTMLGKWPALLGHCLYWRRPPKGSPRC